MVNKKNIFTGLLLVAVIILSMAGCNNDETDNDSKTNGVYPYRILAIGNSFSQDAMRYMRDILIQNGVPDEDIEIVSAHIDGQTLEGHYMNARFDLKHYTRDSFGTTGSITRTYGVTLKSILESNNWDYITLQQASHESGNPASYKNDEINYLINYAKTHCPNPNVKIGWHKTWAYAKNSTHPSFSFYSGNQMTMYNAIIDTVQTRIKTNNGFDFIIPVGSAIQNSRSVFGDTLCSDGYHLNDRGRFIAGAMWLRQIYDLGLDVFDSYQTQTITLNKDDIMKIEKSVQDAFDAPFQTDYEDSGIIGEPPPFEGNWYSSQWQETFTFDMEAKTFSKMRDEGWGERGTFTYTAGYNPNTFICTITHITNDGFIWNTPAPSAQLVWIRTYSFSGEDKILINGHEYIKDTETDSPGVTPYRILAIGNSFSQDAMRYMRVIMTQNGIPGESISIVNAYIGGQTLAGHANNARNNSRQYTRESFRANGSIARAHELTLREIIESNEWDYITLQQASHDSGREITYNDDIQFLIDYAKEHCSNPNVKIGWHMTWAYAANSTHSGFPNYGSNQMTMYNAIINAVQTKIVPMKTPAGDFEFIIPVGTAIQNARTAKFGDNLCSDGYHLNDTGRFIAAAMWVRQIYGKDIDIFDTFKTMTVTLNRDDILIIKKNVQDAFNAPFAVTP